MQEFIKSKRVELDSIIKKIDLLTPSREVSLAKTKIQIAMMFSGKALGKLNTEKPYPDNTDASNDKIEPRADVSLSPIQYAEGVDTEIKKIKSLRAELLDIIQEFHDQSEEFLDETYNDEKHDAMPAIYMIMILTSLEEGSIWLGMELGRILDISTT